MKEKNSTDKQTIELLSMLNLEQKKDLIKQGEYLDKLINDEDEYVRAETQKQLSAFYIKHKKENK